MSNLKEKYKAITENPNADDVPNYQMQKVVRAYEKGRADVIDECLKTIMKTNIRMANDYQNEICCIVKNEIKDILIELKEK